MAFKLTNEQEQAVDMVAKHGISLLIGGPGTGKSTTIKEVLKYAQKNNMTVLQAAPTGKASKRMIEATRHHATTIHSMLGCIYDEKTGGFEFKFNEDEKLLADLIIIDEVSMITLELMSDLLKAINSRRTKLLLVGDSGQLPSVGPGAVLRDMLSSGIVPYTELTTVQRNTGYIVEACSKIKDSVIYEPKTKLNIEAKNPVNLIHIECPTSTQTSDRLIALISKKLPEKYDWIDSVKDIQIISQFNDKGDLSCLALNLRMQDEFNKEDDRNRIYRDLKKTEPSVFRINDKVINTKNTDVNSVIYDPINQSFTHNPKELVHVVNGDMGWVIGDTGKHLVVLFSDPNRVCAISKNAKHIGLAYAITCHKFQGSESPVIVIPVHSQHNMMISNAWIYTAISRAKKICVTIGLFETVKRGIRNKQDNHRNTRLKKRLAEANQDMIESEFSDL